MIVPRIPAGISGTALAASLLRDGWSVSHIIQSVEHSLFLTLIKSPGFFSFVTFSEKSLTFYLFSWPKCMPNTKKLLMLCNTSNWGESKPKLSWNGYVTFNNYGCIWCQTDELTILFSVILPTFKMQSYLTRFCPPSAPHLPCLFAEVCY